MPDVRSHTSLRKQESPAAALAKWYTRWLAHGEDGLMDRFSRPIASPNRTSEDIADLVEALRRQTKYGPARLAAELKRLHGITVAPKPHGPPSAPVPAPGRSATRTCTRRSTTTPGSPTPRPWTTRRP
jgi:hypothetical protein